MIKVNPVGENWRSVHADADQKEKFSIYDWIKKFETELRVVSQSLDIDTVIDYYNHYPVKRSDYQSIIEYEENTPIPYLFKLSPGRYFLNRFNPKLWHRHDIDSTIKSKFINANKYALRSELYQFSDPYILFSLQSTNFGSRSMSKKLLIELVYWAETNKRYILFKLHPFTNSNSKLLLYWKMLEAAGVISKYAILVDSKFNTDNLVQNADAVWTYSSGVGLNAVLQGKPVVAFTDQQDYADLYTICQTPSEVVHATATLDTDRFLSWYYNKLIIDVSRDDLNNQIIDRIKSCVDNNYDIERIF